MIPDKNPFLTMQEKKIAERVATSLVRGIPRVAPTISTSTPEEIKQSSLSSAGDIDDLLSQSVDDGASDLHLSCGAPPRYRVDGDLIDIPQRTEITNDWLSRQIQKIADERIWNEFVENGEADLSYTVPGKSRFRVNVFKQRGTLAAVFRTIPTQIKSIEELNVPDILHELVQKKKGLVLVTGPTGSGKALRLDTPLPTPAGWTTMGEVKVGDELLDSRGERTTVIELSPLNKNPELYRIALSDEQVIFADKDHQWIVSDDYSKPLYEAKTEYENAVKIAEQLLNAGSETAELVNVEELLDLTNDNGASEYFPTPEAIRASLGFMDIVPVVLAEVEGFYNTQDALTALSTRLEQRFSHTDKRFRVMSTLEIVEEQKNDSTVFFLNKLVGSEDSIISIKSVDRVEPDDEEYGAVRCLSVDSPDHSYLCADYVVTHNTTTLTAMLDAINETRREHIVTIEDPIEFVHNNKKSLVNQREVGTDTLSFGEALKRVLRQDPDVILIGELRDAETISTALTAAETGHLVFGTLHTQSASKTIDRIIDTFPSGQQNQVRSQLSDTLQAVVSQMLVKKVGGGRVAATEILINTPAVAANIREGKTSQIYNSISTGQSYGMHTLDQDLKRLVRSGLVQKEEVKNLLVDDKALDNVVPMQKDDWTY